MHLDKASKELVVKIVYASEHGGALDEVSALAAHAKPGTATAIVSRLDDAVRTFELRMPQLQVRGFVVQLKIVGVSLDLLGTGGGGVEKTLFAADAGIVVAGADASRTAAAFARIRTLIEANAPDAGPPLALVAPEPVDGVGDVTIAPNARAALQSLLKAIVAELTKKLEDAQP